LSEYCEPAPNLDISTLGLGASSQPHSLSSSSESVVLLRERRKETLSQCVWTMHLMRGNLEPLTLLDTFREQDCSRHLGCCDSMYIFYKQVCHKSAQQLHQLLQTQSCYCPRRRLLVRVWEVLQWDSWWDLPCTIMGRDIWKARRPHTCLSFLPKCTSNLDHRPLQPLWQEFYTFRNFQQSCNHDRPPPSAGQLVAWRALAWRALV
jgi:hypothetical protein